ncbi:hypothetical protein Pan97_39200 [Bremerella volcania]|uniref:Uncharacterized protein n=1 Tax=Bremerella volcania TaxID=2527984 RepID=A0A518CCB3_9BACT|nr:hypothetical protein [Bremerella volcania]QDU76863.1 hypothetical protein Pan97_39200 [Bremerella volcania]
MVSTGIAPDNVSPLVVFPTAIPDFLLTDQAVPLGPMTSRDINPGRGRIRRILSCERWLLLLLACERRRYPVLVPDELIAACTWGAHKRPKNWRAVLRESWGLTCEASGRRSHRAEGIRNQLSEAEDKLRKCSGSLRWQAKRQRLIAELEEIGVDDDILARASAYGCDESCVYHDLHVPHEHFLWKDARRSLGALSQFMDKIGEDEYTFDFEKRDREDKPLKTLLRKQLYSAYLPIQLFGHSPKVKIPRRQQRLLQGIMRELSHVPGKGRRPGTTAWVEDGLVMPPSGSRSIRCELLSQEQRYANFGGNFNGHRGYQIIGRTRKGWLYRAGYPVDGASDEQLWQWVRFFLADLADLSQRFDLVVAAVSKPPCRCYNLAEMREMLRSNRGKEVLENCRLRIFAPEDYLARWRQWFATKLGYDEIPGGSGGPLPVIRPAHQLVDPIEFRSWMRANKITQKLLAQELCCSESRLSQLFSGSRQWNRSFQQELSQFRQRFTSAETDGNSQPER